MPCRAAAQMPCVCLADVLQDLYEHWTRAVQNPRRPAPRARNEITSVSNYSIVRLSERANIIKKLLGTPALGQPPTWVR